MISRSLNCFDKCEYFPFASSEVFATDTFKSDKITLRHKPYFLVGVPSFRFTYQTTYLGQLTDFLENT